ncbi:MAG: cysteine dioxygenase family protein [Streptosporangiales bacterium]|nr:cysteine dioxygenase family protein [Streptosporangiales bacterium]
MSAHAAILPRLDDTGLLKEVVGGCPRPLLDKLRQAVGARGSWQQTADRVGAVLRDNLPGPEILTAEQLQGDPGGYQTHLLHVEPDGSFSVTAMVWLPGQETPVHDHLTWCVTAVMRGAEYEEIYADEGDHLRVVARNVNGVGEIGAFAPPGDIHLVRNEGDGVAVSMHIYGTDISRVGSSVRRVYDLPVR